LSDVNYLINQAEIREKSLHAILASDNPRKIIIAGPGTGKTFTFEKLFRLNNSNKNLALTFIRKLVEEMEQGFGDIAEVKTFHAYCKMLLHKQFGSLHLVPFLTSVVKEDSQSIGAPLDKFRDRFQTLDEDSPEINYYLRRGDYYNAVSFDDSVYKVYQSVKEGNLSIPQYEQIVIDEFQDFNSLEIELIKLLEQKNKILLVGDDDQAIYANTRNSSPEHLREFVNSGKYEIFELPYCSRCPSVVVEATSAFIDSAGKLGGLRSRAPKPFFPYLEGKEYENKTYPKVITAETGNIAGLSTYLENAIARIPEPDIQEAYANNYSCVLIIGARQYLNPINKRLQKNYPLTRFSQAKPIEYTLSDGYYYLLKDEESNLGWRILAGCELSAGKLRTIVKETHDGTNIKSLLEKDFVRRHADIIKILRAEDLSEEKRNLLEDYLGEDSTDVSTFFFPPEEEEPPQTDQSLPTILLSSFEGCKGLSAGHVFIVGLNQGLMPKMAVDFTIPDIEYSKFIVAMTRTRKELHLLSNRWDYSYKDGPRLFPSSFIKMIPEELRHDGGYLRVKQMQAFFENI